MRVHILTVAERIGAVSTFHDEAEMLVKVDGRCVVHIDGELQSPDTEPLVRRVDQSGEKRSSDPSPRSSIMYSHAKAARMSLSARKSIKPGLPYDLAVHLRHQLDVGRRHLLDPARDFLRRVEGQAHCPEPKTGQVHQGRQGFRVTRPTSTDGQARELILGFYNRHHSPASSDEREAARATRLSQ